MKITQRMFHNFVISELGISKPDKDHDATKQMFYGNMSKQHKQMLKSRFKKSERVLKTISNCLDTLREGNQVSKNFERSCEIWVKQPDWRSYDRLFDHIKTDQKIFLAQKMFVTAYGNKNIYSSKLVMDTWISWFIDKHISLLRKHFSFSLVIRIDEQDKS